MAEAATLLEEVAHDDLCPICQLLLYIPVKTQCNHLLCASCMAQWADASTTTSIEVSSADVELENFDPNYDPTYDLVANCPMCRTHTTAAPDEALARLLETKYPITYAERRKEEEIERGSMIGSGGVEGVMILIGNKHKLESGAEDDNQHDWTFFVRTSRPDLIKHVRIYLHPTFRPPQLILRNPPYEVRRLGWGTFTLEAEIVLKEPYSWVTNNSGTRQAGLELTWTLSFEEGGRQGRVRRKVRKLETVLPTEGPRVLRSGRLPAAAPARVDDDEDDEEDDDYDDDEMDADGTSTEEEEEEVSEFLASP